MLEICEENIIDIHEQAPVSLAFVGDGVYELLVRSRLVAHTRLQPNMLNRSKVHYVCAASQFIALKALEPLLTEKEQGVVRRGKNATKATVAKHATAEEYRASTALEALFGYLYLQNETQRIAQLFDVAWQTLSEA